MKDLKKIYNLLNVFIKIKNKIYLIQHYICMNTQKILKFLKTTNLIINTNCLIC